MIIIIIWCLSTTIINVNVFVVSDLQALPKAYKYLTMGLQWIMDK